MDGLRQDLAYALRTLARRPGFTAVAVLTLALGIGANAAIFSIVDAVMLRRLPFDEPDRLVMLWLDNERLDIRTDITSYPAFRDWRERATSLSGATVYRPRRASLTGDGEPVRLAAARVPADFLPLVGSSPALGRGFTAEEDREGGGEVVVLGHALWQRRFAGDPGILGRSVELDGTPHTVVGVMPPGFDFPAGAELWQPLAISDRQREAAGSFWLYVLARLAPDVSLAEAQAEMSAIAAARAAEDPELNAGYGIWVQPLRRHLAGPAADALVVLLGAVAFVLLIACANVANLLLARAAGRHREMSVRLALGAGRGRLVRQLLTESAVLAAGGGAAGVGLAFLGVAALVRLAPADLLPAASPVAVDLRVLAFTAAVALATGLAVGLAPALTAARSPLATGLKEGGRGASGGRRQAWTRQALVVAEVAVAAVLLVGAGLLLRSFQELQRVDPGLRAEGVLTADLSLSRDRYPDPAAGIAFYGRLLERLAALPGVTAAGATSEVLLPELARSSTFAVEGRPDPPAAEMIEVPIGAQTPGTFAALGMPIVAGRDFTAGDDGEAPEVVIVNRAMARRFWPGESPLGRRIKYGDQESDGPWRTVVGVVGDARRTSLERDDRPSTYLPFAQAPFAAMTLVLRTAGAPLALAEPLRQTVWSLDFDLPVSNLAPLAAQLDERVAQRRFNTLLLGFFSALALVLAVIGVYGVIAHAVAGSRREIGVRIALGAGPARVLREVAVRGLAPVVLGLTLGLAAAAVLSRTVAGLLYGVGALDPLSFTALPLALLAAAAAATWLPARRAAVTDPVLALRDE